MMLSCTAVYNESNLNKNTTVTTLYFLCSMRLNHKVLVSESEQIVGFCRRSERAVHHGNGRLETLCSEVERERTGVQH